MKREIDLSGDWKLKALRPKKTRRGTPAKVFTSWIPMRVPGSVHEALLRKNLIPEPLIGDGSFKCRWVEDLVWFIKKDFQVTKKMLSREKLELDLRGLDTAADIRLNNKSLGDHRNCHRPFLFDLSGKLKQGRNTLTIHLSTGLEEVTKVDVASMAAQASDEKSRGKPERGDPRRPFVRKPQFTVGWDWNPRLTSIAVGGNACIHTHDTARIHGTHVRPIDEQGKVELELNCEIETLHYYRSKTLKLEAQIEIDGQVVASISEKVLGTSGFSFFKKRISLPNPRMWWPRDMGPQNLYTITWRLKSGSDKVDEHRENFGVRFIRWEFHPSFRLFVNDKPVFCKGANWIPGDAVYTRLSDVRMLALLDEAVSANFNMLRIWGGGLYERSEFYHACDREGILVWQDFMFACSPYPDHLERFCQDVSAEAEYQVKRLRNHPCIALWCGNNENHWGFCDWWGDKTRSGAKIYNEILPRITHHEHPEVAYWNSSPYGGDDSPNNENHGDRHQWHFMFSDDIRDRVVPQKYDTCRSPFISEYGYVGPCQESSTLKYLGTKKIERHSKTWNHHNNTFERETVDYGISRWYADAEGLPVEDYLLYGSLCQGLMLGYSLESFRFREDCHGGLFWMYNDSWGEVGWSIIDYYLERKASWYHVKRAFAPIRLIIRKQRGKLILRVSNHTPRDRSFKLQYGYTSMDGSVKKVKEMRIRAKALSCSRDVPFPPGRHSPSKGAWFAYSSDPDIAPAIHWPKTFREMKFEDGILSWKVAERAGERLRLQINTQMLCHAVEVQVSGEHKLSDNYFDLIPGQRKFVEVLLGKDNKNPSIDVTPGYQALLRAEKQ